jgi:hypothetical protein
MMMSKRKTHFEQVPLEVVKKIVEEQPRQQETQQPNNSTKQSNATVIPTLQVKSSLPEFDIFEKEAGGSVLWRQSAITLDEAKARVRELAKRSPTEYIVVSQRTGSQFVIRPTEAERSRFSR